MFFDPKKGLPGQQPKSMMLQFGPNVKAKSFGYRLQYLYAHHGSESKVLFNNPLAANQKTRENNSLASLISFLSF
jgi:hypothetical protein